MARRPTVLAVLAALTFVLVGAACGAPSTGGGASWPEQMLAQVNAQRAAAGAPAVQWCGTLARSAQGHSADQAARNTMSHTGSDGSTVAVRANRARYVGWTALGENVAAGFTSVSGVMGGWMGSAAHRAAILNPAYTHLGAGLASSGAGRSYWTQDFGRSGTC